MKKFTKPILCILAFVISVYLSGWFFNRPSEPLEGAVIHYMDVGQGDCEIIQIPDGRNILIDGGTNKSASKLIGEIRSLGIGKFDYVIATHPHEDHIGGLDSVIESFSVGCVYMPDKVSTSNDFENLLDAIEQKGVDVKKAKAGQIIIDESNIKLVLVAPNGDNYNETNDYSAVAKFTYGNCSFLFTGDAEAHSEGEIIKNGMDISADVLKVGHHGSNSSTTTAFLRKVKPKYAVIEVGEDNSYGHPHKEVLQRLTGVKIYRTDINGNITMMCDGNNIEITTKYSEEKND